MEEDPYEAQPGVQGEGGVGGTARPGVGGRDCAPLQGPRQRSLQVETAAARQRGAVVRDGPWRWRGVGAGGCPTQEDRRADGGAGFVIQRARALPMTQRRVLMAPNGTLSMRRQCALLAVTRSSVYYEPVVPDAEELALMRRIDELHLQHPFFGSRMITQTLKAEGPVINRKRVPTPDAVDGAGEHGATTHNEHAGAGPPRLPVSAAGAHDRTAEPGLGHGYHLHPDGARLRLPGGDHRLVLPPGPGVAAVQHAGHGLLPRGVEGRPRTLRPADHLQHRPGLAVHGGGLHPRSARPGGSRSAWTARAATSTTSSWSGSGGR